MKYYKIDLSFYNLNDKNRKITSCANGDKIPNANEYFYRMRDGEVIKDAPIFDYFFLESYESRKHWEDYLLDAHGFIGEGSQILGWLISGDFKLLLENFNLSISHCLYPSKLLYKENKLDYYIFQFGGNKMSNQLESQIDFSKSNFWDIELQKDSFVKSSEDFTKEYRRIFRKNVVLKKLSIKKDFIFFPMSTFLHDNIVSERLKDAIETMGITGFEFSELDYEVVVE